MKDPARLAQLRQQVLDDHDLTDYERSRLLAEIDSRMPTPADGEYSGPNRLADFGQAAAAGLAGSGIRGTAGSVAGLGDLALKGVDAFIPGDAIKDDLLSAPVDRFASGVERVIDPDGAQTGWGVAGGITGNLVGTGAALVGTGGLALARGAKVGQAIAQGKNAGLGGRMLAKLADTASDLKGARGVNPWFKRRGIDMAIAAPFNVGQANMESTSLARNLAPFADLETPEDAGLVGRAGHAALRGMGQLGEAAQGSFAGRLGYELGFDAVADLVMGGVLDNPALRDALRRGNKEAVEEVGTAVTVRGGRGQDDGSDLVPSKYDPTPEREAEEVFRARPVENVAGEMDPRLRGSPIEAEWEYADPRLPGARQLSPQEEMIARLRNPQGRLPEGRAGGAPDQLGPTQGASRGPLAGSSPDRGNPLLPKQDPDATVFREASPEEFHAAVTSAAGAQKGNVKVGDMLSDYTPEEFGKMQTFLSEDGLTGYAIKDGNELVSVFNAGTKGRGSSAVKHAIDQGATRGDHFDGYLTKFYRNLGFREVRREANWTPGEPDVVFIELPKKLRPNKQGTARQLSLNLDDPASGAALREVVQTLGIGTAGAAVGATQGESEGRRAWNALKYGVGAIGLSILGPKFLDDMVSGGKSGHVVPPDLAKDPVGAAYRHIDGFSEKDIAKLPEKDIVRLSTGEVIATRANTKAKWRIKRTLSPEEVAGERLPATVKAGAAVEGYDDPEAFGAALLWARGNDPEAFQKGMVERFGEGTYDLDKSAKFLEKRMNEVLDPVNDPMPDFKGTLDLIQRGVKEGGHKWYNEVRPAVAAIFGDENADAFIRAYAVTSAGAGAYTSNIKFAVKALLSHKFGLPFTPTAKTSADKIQSAMEAVGGIIGDRKVNSFSAALGGNPLVKKPLAGIVNDIWNHRGFGFGKISRVKNNKTGAYEWKLDNTVTPTQYRFMQEGLNLAGKELGMQGSEVQGAFWIGVKKLWEGLEKEIRTTDDIPKHLRSQAGVEAPLGETVYKARPSGAMPPLAPALRQALDDPQLQKLIKEGGTVEELDEVLKNWSGNGYEEMAKGLQEKMGSEILQAGARAGFASQELVKEIALIGAGATGGALMAPEGGEAAGALAGAAALSHTGRKLIGGFGRTLTGSRLNWATTAQTLGSAAAGMGAMNTEDRAKAGSLYLLSAALGGLAARDMIPGVKAAEKAVAKDLLWDRVIMGTTHAAMDKAYEISPALGNFAFGNRRLGEGYQALKRAREQELREWEEVARGFWERFNELGEAASKVASKAVDEGTEGADLRRAFEDAGVEDVDGAVQAVEDIHKAAGALGDLLVGHQLLAQTSRNKFDRRYLARLYKDADGVASEGRASGKTRLQNLGRLKKRGELKEGMEERLIDDAGFRAATTVLQESNIAATENMFKAIAANPKWVDSEFNRLSGEARWLKLHMKEWDEVTQKEVKARLQDIAGRQRELGEELQAKGWRRMPEGQQMGSLAGQYVHPDVAYDLDGFKLISHDGFDKMMKGYTRALQQWKKLKTAYNPGTWGRNIVGSQLLSFLGDGPMPFGATYMQAVEQAMAKKGPLYEAAKKWGLTEGSHLQAELKATQWGDGPQGVAGKFGKAGAGLGAIDRKITEGYYHTDVAARIAYFQDAVQRRGLGEEEAAKLAKEWVPTYENLPPLVKLGSKFGPPFISYAAVALPKVAEAVATKPLRYLAFVTALYAMSGALVDNPMPEEWKPAQMKGPLARFGAPEGLQKAAEFMFPSYVATGQDEETGKETYLDFTYVMPWGDLAEGAGKHNPLPALFNPVGNPLVKTAVEFVSNRDMFTGQDIRTPSMTFGEKAAAHGDRILKTALPSLTPGVGYGWQKMSDAVSGTPNRWTGDVRSTDSAFRDALGGMKERQIDPEREKQSRVWEVQREKQDLQRRIQRIARDRSLTPERKQELIDKERRKLPAIMERLQRIIQAR